VPQEQPPVMVALRQVIDSLVIALYAFAICCVHVAGYVDVRMAGFC
jgi:hypothetical protein